MVSPKSLRENGSSAGGRLARFEIFLREWIIGGEDAVLHREVQARRRLARARHADQDHVGAPVIARDRAVVVGQREVGGVDAHRIGVRVCHAMCPVGDMRRHRLEFGLERCQERVEEIQEKTRCFRGPRCARPRCTMRREYDRPHTLLLARP